MNVRRHVAVVGAGVVGLACATVLQMRGHRVTLIDPQPPGEGCSAGNAGALSRASCVPLGLPGMWKHVPRWLLDPAGPLAIRAGYLPWLVPWLWQFQRASTPARVEAIADALHALLDPTIERWRPLAQRAEVPQLIVQNGYAFAYASEAAFAADALGHEIRRRRGVAIEILTGPAIREFEPALSPQCTHLAFFPEQGHCPNPLRLSRALAAALRAHGAQFENRRVVAFDIVGGRVARVITEGAPVDADAVVLAAGAHSKPLARALGSDVPLETERGYHVMLAAPSAVPRIPVGSGEGKYFATPMEEGLRIAGTVELAGLAAPPDYRRADVLLAGAKRLLPALRHGEVARWMGHRPSFPDSLPVIGRSARYANAFFAFGHGHIGLAAAAPTAAIVADLVEARPPSIDVAPYRAERFG